ncbi:MAG: hypothetical protein QOF01_5457 [Thermomicrobiales bacterium]|jgi:hypothetical protein|nr:hypothetical protein [Thermomicrobiales bacterium]MEA2524164.1 hypothetical protein [Thermomicrobiales bacterium]MEA2598988.1 hypothetical protein [Thermomicrobiales bacterium]
MASLGRILIAVGAAILCLGLFLTIAARVPLLNDLGRLPGDFVWRRGSTTVYLPIATSLVVSLVLSIILGVILRR